MFHWKKTMALGAVLASVATPALALPPGTAVDMTLTISGASASDAFLGGLATDLCLAPANDLTTFLSDAGVIGTDEGLGIDGGAQQAYSCTLDSSKIPGMTAVNPTALIQKYSTGGSGNGVGPVCNSTNLNYMNVTVANCVDGGGPANRYVCGLGSTTAQVPNGGVSDVAPNEVGAGLASNNCTIVKSTFGTGFAAIATTRLRNALQEAQGLVPGSELPQDMPSISTEQLASISTGRVGKWSQFKVRGQPLTNFNGGPNVDFVTVCRRVESSGTTAAFKLRVMKSPSGANSCANGAQVLTGSGNGAGTTGNPATGPFFLAGASSATDEGTCVANQDVAIPPGVTISGVPVTTSNWTIGLMQSTEENAGQNVSYRFLRLDGVLPTIDNIANGTYKWWTESTMQWKTASVSADQAALLTAIANEGAAPPRVASANTPALHPWGQGGKVSLASGGCAVDPDNDDLWSTDHPCSPYANTFSGNTNNCTGSYVKSQIETVLGPNEDNQLDGDANNPP